MCILRLVEVALYEQQHEHPMRAPSLLKTRAPDLRCHAFADTCLCWHSALCFAGSCFLLCCFGVSFLLSAGLSFPPNTCLCPVFSVLLRWSRFSSRLGLIYASHSTSLASTSTNFIKHIRTHHIGLVIKSIILIP